MKIKCVFLLVLCTLYLQAQNQAVDSIPSKKFDFKPLILPSLFVGYGFVALNNPTLFSIDTDIQESFDTTKSTRIDDVTMFLPAASVYGLNMIGIKGKNNFKRQIYCVRNGFYSCFEHRFCNEISHQKRTS